MAARLTLAEHDDLSERVFVLKEAVRAWLFLEDMGDAGHEFADMVARRARALTDLREALNEDGPDDRRAARC